MTPLRALCVTWNAKGTEPIHSEIEMMLTSSENAPEIIAFTVQETLEMKFKKIVSATIKNSKPQKWKEAVELVVKTSEKLKDENYTTIKHCHLLGMFIIVFIKDELKSQFKNVKIGRSSANTTFGNKGGVAVRFDLERQFEDEFIKNSFCFVGVHLSSSEGADKKKNSDLDKITNQMRFSDKKTSASQLIPRQFLKSNKNLNKLRLRSGDKPKKTSQLLPSPSLSLSLSPRPKRGRNKGSNRGTLAQINAKIKRKFSFAGTQNEIKELKNTFHTPVAVGDMSGSDMRISVDNVSSEVGVGNAMDLLDHDVIVIFGDLNYRVEGTDFDSVISAVKKGGGTLRELQINHDHLQKNMIAKKILKGFNESTPRFSPTYKFEVGTSDYIAKRTPSWTDRIVYKTSDTISNIKVIQYESIDDIVSSDHKPVFKEFYIE